MNLDDTIVAIATPAGRGGIGVVRLAGPEARSIAEPMLRLKHTLEPGRAVFGELIEPSECGAGVLAHANAEVPQRSFEEGTTNLEHLSDFHQRTRAGAPARSRIPIQRTTLWKSRPMALQSCCAISWNSALLAEREWRSQVNSLCAPSSTADWI